MTKVSRSIDVQVPVTTAYNRWTRFEEFPRFMGGVQQVEQLDPRTLRWVAEIAGIRRQWTATILEQVPDRKIAWAATEGATNAGAVLFAPSGPDTTTVTLELDYEPEGLVEKAGDAVGLVDRQATADLERFKQLVESTGQDDAGWRGAVSDEPDVGIPTADDAAASRGDSGGAGVSGTAAVAGAVVAGAAVAGVAAARSSSGPGEPIVVSGDQDVVDVLTADHREATGLIAQIRSASDPGQRRDLADILISELVRHAVAEEMYVYPAMRDHRPDGAAAVEHDTQEHHDLEVTMKQLEGLDAADPQFEAALAALETTLLDHIADEEADQFPQLRTMVPAAQLVELAGKVETAKRLAPTRPHPSAPNAALFHKLAGPGVGLVDRLRDRLTGRSTG